MHEIKIGNHENISDGIRNYLALTILEIVDYGLRNLHLKYAHKMAQIALQIVKIQMVSVFYYLLAFIQYFWVLFYYFNYFVKYLPLNSL